MKVIALLPMKGNSERVPNKNLKEFNGKPLFHHVLNSLITNPNIDEVIINTDSDNIASSAQDFNKVIIHHRPKNICGDFVSMNEIIAYDIENSSGDIYLQTHSTNPLLKSETISKAINAFKHTDNDSLFSVTKMQTRLYWKDGNPVNHNPEELLRTQDLEPIFEENSNIFIFTKESFKKSGNKRIGLNPQMFVIDKLEAIDIDEPQDFIIAEAIQKLNIID